MDENINFNNEFIINKNIIKYPLSKNKNNCHNYCLNKNAINRSENYINDNAEDNICDILTSRVSLNKNSNLRNNEHYILKYETDPCNYVNITNYDFTISPLLAWPLIINTKIFLEKIYNIINYDSYINILSDQDLTLLTKLRITNAYYQTQMEMYYISDTLIEFYVQVIKQLWISDLYDYYYKYIFVDNDKIYIKKNDQDKKFHKKEKINYFIEKFASRSKIYNYIEEYNSYYTNIMTNSKNDTVFIISLEEFYFKFIDKRLEYIL